MGVENVAVLFKVSCLGVCVVFVSRGARGIVTLTNSPFVVVVVVAVVMRDVAVCSRQLLQPLTGILDPQQPLGFAFLCLFAVLVVLAVGLCVNSGVLCVVDDVCENEFMVSCNET